MNAQQIVTISEMNNLKSSVLAIWKVMKLFAK